MATVNNEIVDTLAARAQNGDRQAFSHLVKMTMNQVVGLTYRMTGDRQTAQDLAQDTFISAWENIGKFRGEARFTSWLYRIAANRALNHLKAKSTQTVALPEEDGSLDGNLVSAIGNPEREFDQNRLRSDVIEFMATLPPMQQTVFELRFYEDMPFEEISRTVGKALGTVKTHYRQAVIKLREWARRRGWQE